MRFPHLLIVTYGRSGSTLLQGILNSIDGCLVRGENYAFCQGLFQSFQALAKARAEYGVEESSGDSSRPWYGAAEFDDQRFMEDARSLVRHQLVPAGSSYRCTGFKEIRYLNLDREPGSPASDARLREYLWFLVRLFESPAVILLTREHEQVLRSAFWAKRDPAELRLYLEAFERSCARFAGNYPNAFRIAYDDLIGRRPRLRELFGFLGASYDDERIGQVLRREHSTRTRAPRVVAQIDQHVPEARGNPAL